MADPIVDFPHQAELEERTWQERGWAVFYEQGTGKTRPTVRTAIRLWQAQKIQAAIVIAPNGVHRNWISDELPKHCHVPWRGLDWHSAKAKRSDQLSAFASLLQAPRDTMPWLAITYEGMRTESGRAAILSFIKRYPLFMLIGDETSRIKNVKSKRTKKAFALRKLADYARALNGTPVSNSPLDVYAQMLFVDPEYWIRRGIASFTSFRARFAVMKTIKVRVQDGSGPGKGVVLATPARRLPLEPVNVQPGDADAYEEADHEDIVSIDDEGVISDGSADEEIPTDAPVKMVERQVISHYRNLDQLHELLQAKSSRLTKESAGLNLPPKLYTARRFDLLPAQRVAYDQLKETYMLELDGGALVTAAFAMVRLLRLQQITCGYLTHPDDPDMCVQLTTDAEDPRLQTLTEVCEDTPHQGIIWARFRNDIDRIMRRLGKTVTRYDGALTSPKDRAASIDRFRAGGSCKWIVANAAAMGMGHTLTEAKTSIYYSNSFVLNDREQSEDRNHRIGQHNPVLYCDLIADRTVDIAIHRNLRGKKDIAAMVNGDALREWLAL